MAELYGLEAWFAVLPLRRCAIALVRLPYIIQCPHCPGVYRACGASPTSSRVIIRLHPHQKMEATGIWLMSCGRDPGALLGGAIRCCTLGMMLFGMMGANFSALIMEPAGQARRHGLLPFTAR